MAFFFLPSNLSSEYISQHFGSLKKKGKEKEKRFRQGSISGRKTVRVTLVQRANNFSKEKSDEFIKQSFST